MPTAFHRRPRIAGLYGIADAHAGRGDPVQLAAQMLRGGCRLLQLRFKGATHDDVVAAARAIAPMAQRECALFIVNDDIEAALRSQADGVHLGQGDATTDEARRRLPAGAVIGRSSGSLAEALQAAPGADYVAIGPVFPTTHLSRPKPTVGLDTLAAARARLRPQIPLVAIGGIHGGNIDEVRNAGASAWAVIGAIAGATDACAATRALLA